MALMKTTSFSKITDNTSLLPVTARVIRLWVTTWGDIEMILFNMERHKMEASISQYCPGTWGRRISEGNTYTFSNYNVISTKNDSYSAAAHEFKITFTSRTQAKEVQDCGIPRYAFSLHTVSQIRSIGSKATSLIDFIGIVTRVKGVHTARKTRIVFEMEDIVGGRIEVVLFEEFVDQIKELCRNADAEGVVILLAGVKITLDRTGDLNLVQAFSKTALITSSDIPDVAHFKSSILATKGDQLPSSSSLSTFTETSLESQFLDETMIRSVDYFMHNPEIGQYIVKAKVDCFESSGEFVWFYLTCPLHTSTLESITDNPPLEYIREDCSLSIPPNEPLQIQGQDSDQEPENGVNKSYTALEEGSGSQLVVVIPDPDVDAVSGSVRKERRTPLSSKFKCRDCNKEVTHLYLRYKVQLCVSDRRGCASLILWGRDVQDIIGKPCPTIKRRQEQRNRLKKHPEELLPLVGQEYLFKVTVTPFNKKSKNNKAYSIKAMLNNKTLLQKFNALRSDSLTYSGALIDISSEVGSTQDSTPSEKRKSDELDADTTCKPVANQSSEVRSYNKRRVVKMEKLD